MNTFSPCYTPAITAKTRQKIEDFIVEEIPIVTPEGEGEHLWLLIRKTGANTDWVAGQLAQWFGVKRHDVGFAGLKDRHAITTQWFSIYLPGKTFADLREEIPEALASSIEILEQTQHKKKLRRGTLKGNRFTLILRDCEGDFNQLEETLEGIKQKGIPNYFGEQRFGRDFGNISSARDWFNGNFKPRKRQLKSLYLSAARSWLFNLILSSRVDAGIWNKALSGDVFMLEGSHSWFPDDKDKSIPQRLDNQEIHPTAVLWGKGQLDTTEEAASLEKSIADQEEVLAQGLIKEGVKKDRRALRVLVGELSHQWKDSTTLELSFTLPAGSYATVALAQIMRNPAL
ncbi:MAG: tRNA pseudouridine(13) synthase TruD [Thiotrichaceae bacterium]|nr:tRNA pseudouridine(13) synthase TruD [Thiotrichaceae bacterium]